MAKYVELPVECLRTRVQFPPSTPINERTTDLCCPFFLPYPHTSAFIYNELRTSPIFFTDHIGSYFLSTGLFSLPPHPVLTFEVRTLNLFICLFTANYERTDIDSLLWQLVDGGNIILGKSKWIVRKAADGDLSLRPITAIRATQKQCEEVHSGQAAGSILGCPFLSVGIPTCESPPSSLTSFPIAGNLIGAFHFVSICHFSALRRH